VKQCGIAYAIAEILLLQADEDFAVVGRIPVGVWQKKKWSKEVYPTENMAQGYISFGNT
jgi:hypothetical protein